LSNQLSSRAIAFGYFHPTEGQHDGYDGDYCRHFRSV